MSSLPISLACVLGTKGAVSIGKVLSLHCPISRLANMYNESHFPWLAPGCCKLLLQPSLPFSLVVSCHCSGGTCVPPTPPVPPPPWQRHPPQGPLHSSSIPGTLISPHSARSSVILSSPARHFVKHRKPILNSWISCLPIFPARK